MTAALTLGLETTAATAAPVQLGQTKSASTLVEQARVGGGGFRGGGFHRGGFHAAHRFHHPRFSVFVGAPLYTYNYAYSDCWWSRRYHRWICPSYY
jgi:hypothetical protein